MNLPSGWNLPPGCFERDLPGNSPDDELFDWWLEHEAPTESGHLTDEELEKAFVKWKLEQDNDVEVDLD